MITLKEALKLNKDEIKELRADLAKKIKETKYLGAYVEQLTNEEINTNGEGIPIAVKDNIQVKGWSVTCSSKILQGYVSPYDATVITNMAKANLSAFGRTNMDEFAMGSTTATSFYGKTLNPADNERVPGGSSGGSAAAVAGGIAIAALGSDTGGSIRQPAAFCGCVGLKPTYGKVSRYGLTAFSSSLDQIGPITQNVEDAAILFDIIAGHESKDSTSANIVHTPIAPKLNPNRKLKIAVIENFLNEASEDIQKSVQNSIAALRSNGHEIIYKNMLNSKYDVATYYVVATAEASANLSRFDGVRYGRRVEGENLKEMYVKTRSEGFGDEVKRRILLGTFVLSSGYYDAYYIQAQKARHLIKENYENIFKEADLIFSPVTPTTAFKFGQISNPLEMYLSDIYTIGVNLAGVPAISVPIGKGDNGLPVGGQLIAKPFDEQTLLDGALSLETILKGK
ncbi:MAG: Asp-tRNA(Asn)/Glu-tRNA(Gln) amidotransferase subunit GatA [Campylobacteraceae bacterium]|jgi:aspartyl-tRNA(Asn)/glutamyl-tRNA(Gln) amidotransferase subunit A|nr:Asp-tRNA(Asn)/Glu-tRNA(Gln) amidotransferase subunit GatA [Campylobacteraceae bacterium]